MRSANTKLNLARHVICEAIRRKKLLQFSYKNHTRVVEPHIYGRDSAGHDLLSAYLVGGHSESKKRPYWRFYRLSDVTLLTMLNERFSGAREDRAELIVYRQLKRCAVYHSQVLR